MSEAKQEIKKLSELLEMKNLTIPEYQRPYKWKSEQVTQLLEDIFEHIITKEKTYRIGSLILHEDNKKDKDNNSTNEKELNIVDGQQRLTTISILLYLLDDREEKQTDILLLSQPYRHKISNDNIVFNKEVIEKWLLKISDKENFQKQLIEKCEFVLFTVYEQDEAFQLFDSQNARGKSLEPYDLLKAFHLREMEFDTETDKAKAVEHWENAIDNGALKPILGNHLFKIRKWVKNEWKYDFTKDDIDEFKGISLHQIQQFPYESSLRMLDGFVENAQHDKFLKNNHIAQAFPFSITMPIINGKRFFEYVEHYVQLRYSIFSKNEDTIFIDFYKIYCLGEKETCVIEEGKEVKKKYHEAGRTGDKKVRNLYENILLLLCDKFGKQAFEEFYKSFYKAIYSIRCNNKSIRLETILNSPERRILQEINDAISPEKLKKHQYKSYKIDNTNLAKGVDFIKESINNNFITNGQ
ncbi:MAG: DUF262 domain-containing protein [Weeksellaceae bacterium]|nr:DUF262 domain-containing protein [Weeksellaceae bacterium]